MSKQSLVTVKGPVENWNVRGTAVLSYSLTVTHHGLNEHKEVKSREPSMLENKLDALLLKWEEKYDKLLDRKAKDRNAEQATLDTEAARKALEECENILQYTLDVDDQINWDALRRHPTYSCAPPNTLRVTYNKNGKPESYKPLELPSAPQQDAAAFAPNIKWYHHLVPGLPAEKRAAVESRFGAAVKEHEREVARINEKNAKEQEAFDGEVQAFLKAKQAYDDENRRRDEAIYRLEQRWERGDPEAVHEHAEMVLNNSKYLDWMTTDFELGYRPEEKVLVVNYELPAPGDLPTLEKISYVKSRDEFSEKHIPDSRRNKLYDSVCYEIALRTLHELWEADTADNLQGIVFNGFVTAIDPATGINAHSCIMSVHAWKEEFLAINLEFVDPRECFRRLKGVSASALTAIQAVPPKIKLDFEDSRFIESREVAANLDEGTNLAAMHWEDFEHLIRELFSNEFTGKGAEVKVTKGSRDGGVDAIAMDPDPIRGGKIVIQAKRYTNTVGVSAVRDLYGTVLNEGANRGILVTTSHYGPDAYQFADGKNLTLIDGGGLLDLLAKHGHKASIDIAAARLQMD